MLNVLLVEDSPTDALLFTAQLEAADAHVTLAKTLAAAFEALQSDQHHDVTLLDLSLPDSLGLDTLKSFLARFPKMPVVILSGNEDEQLAVAAVAGGAQDFVRKNRADPDRLMRAMRYSIERHQRQEIEQRFNEIERDIAAARRVQQHLLPQSAPQLDGFEVAGVCRPADATGGDFFDFIPGDEGKCDFVVADVSSHGFAPSLIMVGARRVLRTCAEMLDDLDRCLDIVNRSVCDDTLEEQFVTLFHARLDSVARTLKYSAAGHPAWILRTDGEVDLLDSDGPPLGLDDSVNYGVHDSVSLTSGDILVLMTDGAWEAMSPMGEQFGRERVFQLIHEHRARRMEDCLTLFLGAINQFCHSNTLLDDITMVLVKTCD